MATIVGDMHILSGLTAEGEAQAARCGALQQSEESAPRESSEVVEARVGLLKVTRRRRSATWAALIAGEA